MFSNREFNHARKEASAKFATAIDKVQEDVKNFLGGKQSLNVEDVYAIRNHAKANTDINESDSNLTDEQRAWKMTYNHFDAELAKLMGPEQKANMDEIDKRRDGLIEVKQHLEEKLRRDGDDTNKGVFTLTLFAIAGAILSWNLSSTLSAVLYGIFLSLIVGLL